MKKDNNILYFGVFFSIAVLAEIYCIVEKINIIGVSVVVVIATYLLLDAVQTEKAKKNEKIQQYLENRFDQFEKLQKALYVLVKKSSDSTNQQIQELIKEQKDNIERIIDTQNKTAKIVVKYTRDDIKKASSINKVSCEKIATNVDKNIEKLLHSLDVISDNIKRERLVKKEEFDVKEQPSEDEIAELIAAAKEESEESKKDETVVEESIEESKKEADVDPNRQLSEDEIAAMFASMKETTEESIGMDEVAVTKEETETVKETETEEETKTVKETETEEETKTVKETDTEEESKTLEEAESKVEIETEEPVTSQEGIETEEATQKEMPNIDMSDPNKQLSAEEIAALFASMG